MIEKTILDHLNDNMTIPAYMEVPEDSPDRYTIVEKTGSSINNHVLTAVFAIQSIAESLHIAAKNNEEVIRTMGSLADKDEIGMVKLNSDYNFTDMSTKRYRYQAVFNIVHY